MNQINVLLLGVGGNVSLGILKALRMSHLPYNIVGACISKESVGLYLCDRAYISPYADEDTFIPWLIDICNDEKIDIILTGVEEIIFCLGSNLEYLQKNTNAKFICSDLEKLKVGQDKYLTCEWLKDNACNYPLYALTEDEKGIQKLVAQSGFPLIAKPRIGKGAKGVIFINNHEELNECIKLKNYVIEEVVGTMDSEYTVGCYCDKSGKLVDVIIMKRVLKDGTTYKAEVVDDLQIKAEAEKICEAFKPRGPLNIQLRINSEGKPVCFELNVRFSGTTPMRAYYGYNDVEALIKEYVLDEDINQSFAVSKGVSYRYLNEIYIPTEVQHEIEMKNNIMQVQKFKIEIDKLGVENR